ncbi:hypothetical protein [Deinococcus sonorensis]|uniref:Uncharacterized protein n=2 Tax=Deinococcus sonorensis TaxID=309891 RepID=A0AAU7U4L3_9DEIO
MSRTQARLNAQLMCCGAVLLGSMTLTVRVWQWSQASVNGAAPCLRAPDPAHAEGPWAEARRLIDGVGCALLRPGPTGALPASWNP